MENLFSLTGGRVLGPKVGIHGHEAQATVRARPGAANRLDNPPQTATSTCSRRPAKKREGNRGPELQKAEAVPEVVQTVAVSVLVRRLFP